jgi:hypothetical protein
MITPYDVAFSEEDNETMKRLIEKIDVMLMGAKGGHSITIRTGEAPLYPRRIWNRIESMYRAAGWNTDFSSADLQIAMPTDFTKRYT